MEKRDIDAMVAAKTPESRTLDYKGCLDDLGSDAGKLELLFDISAFANTAGGRLIYGVSEARDEEGNKTGEPGEALGLESFDREGELTRIENILAAGIEPRVRITPELIDGFPKGPVLVLWIHQGLVGPHMVKYKGKIYFYSRDNTGKKPMDYHMIRDSFISFLSLNESVRSFQQERLAAIYGGNAPHTLGDEALIVAHAFPLSAFVPAAKMNIPVSKMKEQVNTVTISTTATYGPRVNLDGIVIPHKSQGGTDEYVQIFRTGIVERVHTGFLWQSGQQPPVVVADDIERIIRNGIAGMLAAQRALKVDSPIVVMVAAKGIGGFSLSFGASQGFSLRPSAFDRDEFVLPEVVCEDWSASVDDLADQVLTYFLQAGGIEEIPLRWRRNKNS